MGELWVRNEDIGVAVDDRRHGIITHVARAISVQDLVQKVRDRCPEGTRIPTNEGVHIQFGLLQPNLCHTGHFKV